MDLPWRGGFGLCFHGISMEVRVWLLLPWNFHGENDLAFDSMEFPWREGFGFCFHETSMEVRVSPFLHGISMELPWSFHERWIWLFLHGISMEGRIWPLLHGTSTEFPWRGGFALSFMELALSIHRASMERMVWPLLPWNFYGGEDLTFSSMELP